MKGILFRLKKEAMMGAGKLDLKRMMIWLVDIVLGPELLLIDVYYNYLINRPKFASIWR